MDQWKTLDALSVQGNDGTSVDGRTVVFPVCIVQQDCNLRLVGTGFFILTPSIFVTAKHVLCNEHGLVVPREDITILQVVSETHIRDRRLEHLFAHPTADVAVGILASSENEAATDGHRVLSLSKRIPSSGERICTIAHPETLIDRARPPSSEDSREAQTDTEHKDKSVSNLVQSVSIRTRTHEGTITSFHENGHSIVHGPCFRTSMLLQGGASGGPVFDRTGGVFGINSAGWCNANDSTVSSIRSVLEIVIPRAGLDTGEWMVNCTVEEIVLKAGGDIRE